MNKFETLTLKLGENIRIETYMAKKMGKGHPKQKENGERYAYYSNAKYLNIYLSNKCICNMHIDERYLNFLRLQNNYLVHIKLSKTQEILKDITSRYLLHCHKKMKSSNSAYGTYDIKTQTGREGKLPLLAHHFFEYIEKDLKNSKHKLAEMVRNIDKNYELYFNSEKYNI